MGNWNDADLRNHIKGDLPQLSFERFFEKYNYVNEQDNKYYPFIEKDQNILTTNIVYNSTNNEKLDKYVNTNLKEESPRYTFASTSNNKPMMDSFFSSGNVYLYQLILKINNIWNSMEYTDVNMKKILIPTKSLLQEMLKDILVDNNYKMTKNINNEDELNELVQMIIVKADVDVELANIINTKLFINNISLVKKRLESPLVQKYLNKELNKIVNNEETLSEENLTNILRLLVQKLKYYVYGD